LRYDEYEAKESINVFVFSWGVEHDEEMIVTITLKELDNKSTIIEVNESGLKEDDHE
jgi:hypothetical protein